MVRERPICPLHQYCPDRECSPPHLRKTILRRRWHRHFSLGLSSRHHSLSNLNPHSQANSPYWSQIRLALRTALDSYLNRGHELGRVISYGESAHNEMFDLILREEVLAAQSSDEPERQPLFSSNDPVFAGARGAAEFVRVCPKLPSYGSCSPDLMPRQQGW